MAGKTFPGIGDLEDESSPVAPADTSDTDGTPAPMSPYYSGPTVVDDAKVEEGLQKLRSLDAPADSLPGAADTALDITESGGHHMPEMSPPVQGFLPHLPKDGGRGTFIGHSVVTPLPVAPEPEKPFDDRMRGTLYGHMLHLPELVQAVPEEPSSRELTIVDRSAPTSHAVEVYQPEMAMAHHQHLATGIPEEAEAYPISNRYRSIPIDLEAGSRRRTLVRVAAAAAAIAAIVGAALIWLRVNSDEPEMPVSRPAITGPLAPAHPMIVQPLAPPAPTQRQAQDQAQGEEQPPATGRLDVAPPHPDDEEQPRARPAPERARATATLRPATPPGPAPARANRHGPTAAPPDAPVRSRSKKSQPEEDPDGTLAPSIE